jgi:Fe-S cluster assembly protein SufD
MASTISNPTASVALTGSFTREVFESHLRRVQHLPAWWLERKRAAYARFAEMPFPRRTDEGWRFSNLSGVSLDDFSVPSTAGAEDQMAGDQSPVLPSHLVFTNNRLSSMLADGSLPKGVVVTTIQSGLKDHSDLLKAHLLAQPSKFGSGKFAALHEAFLEDGAFIYVPKGVEVAAPIVLAHQASGSGAAVFPHTLVVAEENARVTVADFFGSVPSALNSQPGEPQLAVGGNDIYAAHGAHVTYIALQDWNRSALSFQLNATVARRDARVLSITLHTGARQARHESFSQLQAPGAHAEMLALTLARGAQEFDQRTLQIHQAPNTSSNLLYKNALLDRARTIFSGLIVVDPDAQKTDAYQSNRNLMLSDDAEAHSLPGLEIQANDVRCTHGATSSRIPAEQEFYLQSRGIRRAQADELLVLGFFEEVLGKIENPQLHDQLTALIGRKFKL